MTDADLATVILDLGDSLDVTPEQRAALDETALRLKARHTDDADERST
ncbi:MAG: hypothetical protein ACSLE1_17290 [Sphingobium sp.]